MHELKITRKEREGLKATFKNFGKPKTKVEIFYDLCFCITAPQTTFKNNRKVIDRLQDIGFYYLARDIGNFEMEFFLDILKPVRFYNQKAKYLIEMKRKFDIIYDIVICNECSAYDKREYLVKEVKGLGYKAASHFLRNLGDKDLAIIDTHILKFLGFTTRYATCKYEYLFYEVRFKNIAKAYNLTVAELDALIWQRYSGTKWEDFKW